MLACHMHFDKSVISKTRKIRLRMLVISLCGHAGNRMTTSTMETQCNRAPFQQQHVVVAVYRYPCKHVVVLSHNGFHSVCHEPSVCLQASSLVGAIDVRSCDICTVHHGVCSSHRRCCCTSACTHSVMQVSTCTRSVMQM